MIRAIGKLLAMLGLVVIATAPASAENRLGIWPGMSADRGGRRAETALPRH